MTAEQKHHFEEVLDAIEYDPGEPSQVTHAICLLCRILLAMVPEPLPEIQMHADDAEARSGPREVITK